MWTNLLPCRKVHRKIEIIICSRKIFNHIVSACLQIFSCLFDLCPFLFIIGFRNLLLRIASTIHIHTKYVLGFKLFFDSFSLFSSFDSWSVVFILFHFIGDTYEVADWVVKTPLPCLGKSLPLTQVGYVLCIMRSSTVMNWPKKVHIRENCGNWIEADSNTNYR